MISPDTVLDTTDPGDDVASRFNYQHCYAAINAIRLISFRDFYKFCYLDQPDLDSNFFLLEQPIRSGGKMVLFKICFALALHLTAAERDLPIPRILVIDSPMKNITPDINPEIFQFFYRELYRLLVNDLKPWQCVVIDQTY